MGVLTALPLTLAALAVASGTILVIFDIIFAVTLSGTSSPDSTRITAIAASAIGSVAMSLMILLLLRQLRYRNRSHVQDTGHGRHQIYLLAGFGGVFAILSGVASALVLGIMRSRVSELPNKTIGSSTSSLIIGGFIVWAVTLISQTVYVTYMVFTQRKTFQQQIQPYRMSNPQALQEMQEATRVGEGDIQGNADYRQSASMESKSPPSSSGRSRSGSDTMQSIRSSLTQVVRPVTSKTKLINNKSPYRPASIDSHQGTIVSIEDGFDSWDTSHVDVHSRQALESASPTPPRFLETIPASPTTSRSASPGFPLDLEPPKSRKRSRSYSPANSNSAPRSRTTSPTESPKEAHIHPLFRSDSPTPAPAATPGTIVTAAPGAGQLLSSSRSSIRSMSRIRSGSLPSSPLMSSSSLDDIKMAMEREERERLEEAGGERKLTPPIPDWVLGAGHRSSFTGYNSRKKPQPGLGKLGET
jgi:hypothetical protein